MPAWHCSSRAFKLALNIYRAWVSEDAVRSLRKTLRDAGHGDGSETGTHAAMVVAEAEPIGGFVGMAISEPLLQAGILVSVIGYMTFLEPWTLVLSVGLPAAAGAVRAAHAAGDQPPRREAHPHHPSSRQTTSSRPACRRRSASKGSSGST